VIRYLASDIQNASGPHVHDPRTGQILESDIQWYHNVMNLLRNWFFIQTAAVNPDARGVEFPDEVMGELIRFVSAHEVGHTIGLQHNMQSSSAYTVAQLRTRFVCDNGVAPSIMDYARFNYVAQPGDDTCLMPVVGPYDKFAIEWGYRPMTGDTDTERAALNAMVADMQQDPVYRFSSPNGEDPTALTEAIGDDAMEASDLGIENLERIVDNLRDWTFQEGEDYDHLEELYNNVNTQWNRYTGHVLANVGGVVQTRKRQGQDGPVFEMVPAETQARAVEYLNRQVFATPSWMLDTEILSRIFSSGVPDRVRTRQVSALNGLLNVDRMKRLVEQEAFHGPDAYGLGDMLTDLRAGHLVGSDDRTGHGRLPPQPAAGVPRPDGRTHGRRRGRPHRRGSLRQRAADHPARRTPGRLEPHESPSLATPLPRRDRPDRRGSEPIAGWAADPGMRPVPIAMPGRSLRIRSRIVSRYTRHCGLEATRERSPDALCFDRR
jgi:hypothetical protein